MQEIQKKFEALKQRSFFISFVGYKGNTRDFGNTMVNAKSCALQKDFIQQQIAEATGLDKIIIMSITPLTDEEQEIVDSTGEIA